MARIKYLKRELTSHLIKALWPALFSQPGAAKEDILKQLVTIVSIRK